MDNGSLTNVSSLINNFHGGNPRQREKQSLGTRDAPEPNLKVPVVTGTARN